MSPPAPFPAAPPQEQSSSVGGWVATASQRGRRLEIWGKKGLQRRVGSFPPLSSLPQPPPAPGGA